MLGANSTMRAVGTSAGAGPSGRCRMKRNLANAISPRVLKAISCSSYGTDSETRRRPTHFAPPTVNNLGWRPMQINVTNICAFCGSCNRKSHAARA